MQTGKTIDNIRSNLIYIRCGVLFTPAGIVRPLWIEWEEERYEVERIYGVHQGNASFGPVSFLQYDCLIAGRKRTLYYDGTGRFFVEKEVPHVS